jgi:hypothetical protein
VDSRELWRHAASESVDHADPGSETPGVRPVRFLYVVARTRLDLFLTIRRQFRDEGSVHVMLDRREQERRSKASPVEFPDRRRQVDRRRPRDYWEDTAQHPAVLIPLSGLARERSDRDRPRSAEVPERDKEQTMERVLLADEARVSAWVQEGQQVLQHVLPSILGERDALRRELEEAHRRGKELQEENDGLRADIARAAAGRRQLEAGHAEIVDSVGQFLAQLGQALEPMRGLAEKLGQARHRSDGADSAG